MATTELPEVYFSAEQIADLSPSEIVEEAQGLLAQFARHIEAIGPGLNTVEAKVDGDADLPFAPGTPGDWAPAPTAIREALEQLAARAKALEGAGGGGLAFTPFTAQIDSDIFSNDFGSNDQTWAPPAGATMLLIKSVTMEQIGGTYAGGANSVNLSTYYDAGKTMNTNFSPFFTPPLPASDYQRAVFIPDGDSLTFQFGDNTFTGETAAYRLTIVGKWL